MHTGSIAEIVKRLTVAGAIETAGYSRGVKCRGYRLANRYAGDRCVRTAATDPRLIERIERERERQRREEQRTRWLPIHYALAELQRCVTLDDAAEEVLESLPDHTRLCQDVLVDRIQQREFSFSVSSTGRVYNAVTGLKRELRDALR
jgi:hypothetical protein